MKKALLFICAITFTSYSQENKNNNEPDVPDPYAIHTQKGQILEQPVLRGDDISILYFQLTGKRVLVSNSSRNIEISIVQPGPITNKEVVELIETQLMMEGFSLIRTPGKPNQLRLLPLGGTSIGRKVITDPDKLPYNDELVSYAMRFNYTEPEEAVGIFQSVMGQPAQGSSTTIVPNTSTLIITDNALTVRSLIDLKKQIDIPSTNINTKFVKIVFADAEGVANQLNELMNEQTTNTNRRATTTGNTRANIPNNGNQPRITLNTSNGASDDIPIRIIADSRTNRITLLGSSEKILRAETLIKEIDIPSSGGGFLRRKLNYLPVVEFMPIAQSAIQAAIGETSGSTGAPGTQRNQTNTAQGGRNNTNNQGQNGGRASLSSTDTNTSPESQLVGKTLLVADNISNSIIVNGPPHHVEIIENLINELDVKSEQIAITAVFGTYSSGDNFSFSSNAVALYDQLTGSPQVGGGTIPGFSGADVSNIFTADSLAAFTSAALSTGLNVGFANTDYGVFINALKDKTNFEEISRPTVFTTNNRSARISSGSRIAVPTGTIFDGGTSSTNIEFIDVVLELEVRPLVNSEDQVTVEIALVRDTLGGTRVIDNLTTQDIDTQELETIVTVPNKSLIILGGLYTDTATETKSGVPLLSDIPLVGKLFSSESDGEDLEELVIMVHTQVVSDDNDLRNLQSDFDKKSYIGPHLRDQFDNNQILEELKKPDKKSTSPFKSSDRKRKFGPKQSHRR